MREVLTTMRSTAPPMTEYRHPLARYSFRAIFADAGARGRFSREKPRSSRRPHEIARRA